MGSCGSLVLLSLLQCVAHFLVIRVPYWVGSSCSFSFTLSPLEHGLCYAFLFPQALPSCPHDFPPLSLQVTGNVALGQHIEVIVQPASRVASSATESTWGSLTAWSWISSLIAPLGQQHPRHWESIPANCQCSLKLDFYFFYLTVPTPIKPSFVAWKMRKKRGKMLVGLGFCSPNLRLCKPKHSAQPREAGNHQYLHSAEARQRQAPE